MALTANDITAQNFRDFYQQILPYLNKGNGGLSECPLGMTAFFDDTVAPDGWLVADGSVHDIVDYPDLANHYERVHGSKNYWGGNGTTTFAVPDWQGEFLRASGTNSHTNQGSGGAVGEHQDGTEIPFAASNSTNYIYAARNPNSEADIPNNIKADNYISGHQRSYLGNLQSTGDGYMITVRPTNTSLLLCIKAVPSGDLYNYSTNERRVGTWIDGKPLYEKTWTGLSVSVSNAWINIISAGNMNLINGVAYQDSNNTIFYPLMRKYGGYVQMYMQGWEGSTINSITLQYTKTTD